MKCGEKHQLIHRFGPHNLPKKKVIGVLFEFLKEKKEKRKWAQTLVRVATAYLLVPTADRPVV